MEQKLAEFRARRRAENVVKKTVADTAPQTETTPTTDTQQTEDSRESPQSSPDKVRYDEYEHLPIIIAQTSK